MKNLSLGTLFWVILFALNGLSLLIVPATSGKDAMFVGDKYIGLVEKLPAKYEIDLKDNMVEIVLNNKYNGIYNHKKDSLEARKKRLQHEADSLFRRRKPKAGRELEREAASIDTTISVIFEQIQKEKLMVSDEDKSVILASIKDTLSMEKYYGQLVSNKLGASYTWDDFTMKRVQKQDGRPYMIGGFSFILAALIFLLFALEVITAKNMPAVIGVGAVSAILVTMASFYTFKGIDEVVVFNKKSKVRELAVRENLTTLRDAQKQFKKYKGKFAGNFDSLVVWLRKDSVQQKKQIQINDSTTEESITMIPAIDVVFPASKYPNLNIDSLIYVPHGDTNKFVMKASTVERNGVVVPVFEISAMKTTYLEDIMLENFDKTSVIKIGDLDKPSYNGNWGE